MNLCFSNFSGLLWIFFFKNGSRLAYTLQSTNVLTAKNMTKPKNANSEEGNYQLNNRAVYVRVDIGTGKETF